ncbi:hypothetical protein [Streptomyces zhihengii]
MLNRIRRALANTRPRGANQGRHRRPLAPSRPSATSLPMAPADSPAPHLPHPRHADHTGLITGEETALVRPYVLAWEKRTRLRPTVVASHLPASAAWSALAGAH